MPAAPRLLTLGSRPAPPLVLLQGPSSVSASLKARGRFYRILAGFPCGLALLEWVNSSFSVFSEQTEEEEEIGTGGKLAAILDF